MSNIVKCDQCGKLVQSSKSGMDEEERQRYDDEYWDLIYVRVEANHDKDHADLCSWNCLAEWSMSKALPTVVPSSSGGTE